MSKEKIKWGVVISVIILLIIFGIIQHTKISSLQEENRVLKSETKQLDASLEEVQEEIQSNINLLDRYQEEIKSSMEWFRKNSKLTGNAQNYLESRCFDTNYELNECYINLACFYLVNEEYLQIVYKTDLITSRSEDKLQSLEEFYENKGGDCEDYALFYKAEYNYLLDECDGNPILKGWQLSDYESNRVWLDNGKNWYIAWADEIILPEEYKYPNIICGEIYDPNINSISGHCVITFTKKEINSIEDLDELDKSPIIEPQNGKYLGLINDFSSEIYLLGDYEENYPPSYIYEVITDKDLFLFDTENNEWLAYSAFYELLGNEKEKLENLR